MAVSKPVAHKCHVAHNRGFATENQNWEGTWVSSTCSFTPANHLEVRHTHTNTIEVKIEKPSASTLCGGKKIKNKKSPITNLECLTGYWRLAYLAEYTEQLHLPYFINSFKLVIIYLMIIWLWRLSVFINFWICLTSAYRVNWNLLDSCLQLLRYSAHSSI